MKRYMLFAGSFYYPSGGLHDFIRSFDTLSEAESEAKKTRQIHPDIERQEDVYEWWHIYDTTTGACVAGSELQGYGAEGMPLV